MSLAAITALLEEFQIGSSTPVKSKSHSTQSKKRFSKEPEPGPTKKKKVSSTPRTSIKEMRGKGVDQGSSSLTFYSFSRTLSDYEFKPALIQKSESRKIETCFLS
jgi:hypothetical protein